jgi:hypothetical protein
MLVVGGRYVRFGSLADMTARSRHVRFTPDSGHFVGAGGTSEVPTADIVFPRGRVPNGNKPRFKKAQTTNSVTRQQSVLTMSSEVRT